MFKRRCLFVLLELCFGITSLELELVGITFDVTTQPLQKAVAKLDVSDGEESILTAYPETLSTLQSAFDNDANTLYLADIFTGTLHPFLLVTGGTI
jgi:hypothetical protein